MGVTAGVFHKQLGCSESTLQCCCSVGSAGVATLAADLKTPTSCFITLAVPMHSHSLLRRLPQPHHLEAASRGHITEVQSDQGAIVRVQHDVGTLPWH